MIQDLGSRIKTLSGDDWISVGAIILVGVISFGFGRLSVIYDDQSDFKIVYPETQEASAILSTVGEEPKNTEIKSSAPKVPVVEIVQTPAQDAPYTGGYVASKSGAKYHFPWCPGAKAIKEENKIFFATREEAEARGYTKAANCKGL